jgi:2-iminobutanoate/2-iminopropanoate deaminase
MTHLKKTSGPVAEFYAPENNRYPFSEAVRVGDTIYLSGQIGINAGGLVPGFDAQVTQMMDNVQATLKGLGLGMEHLVKCSVFMDDMDKWPAFNAIYVSYFDAARLPARSAFGASGLALGAEVEIDCIAMAPAAA